MMRLVLLLLVLSLTACGSVLEPVPCTPETADRVAHDAQGRLIAFQCL